MKRKTFSILTRMRVIVKLLSPKKQIVVQQIENEYIILITAQESDKGLSPLINDTNKLLDFVHKNDTKFQNVFRDECKITFSTTNKNAEKGNIKTVQCIRK